MSLPFNILKFFYNLVKYFKDMNVEELKTAIGHLQLDLRVNDLGI